MFVEGEINPNTGFVIDYAEITSVVKPLIEKLDHKHLGATIAIGWETPSMLYNTVEGMPDYFYPSSENLLNWIGEQLSTFPWTALALEETCTSYAELSRKEFNETHHESRG